MQGGYIGDDNVNDATICALYVRQCHRIMQLSQTSSLIVLVQT